MHTLVKLNTVRWRNEVESAQYWACLVIDVAFIQCIIVYIDFIGIIIDVNVFSLLISVGWQMFVKTSIVVNSGTATNFAVDWIIWAEWRICVLLN